MIGSTSSNCHAPALPPISTLPPSPQKLSQKSVTVTSAIEDDLRNKLSASQLQITELTTQIQRLQSEVRFF